MPPKKDTTKATKKKANAKVATPKLSPRVSKAKNWEKRLKTTMFMTDPPGLTHVKQYDENGKLKKYGHSGFIFKKLGYLYNPNDSKWWPDPSLMVDGFQFPKYTEMPRPLLLRKDPFNYGPDTGEGLCYLISFYIAKIINSIFKKQGKEGVDEANKQLVKISLDELYDWFSSI